MAVEGVDFSWARPGGAALAKAGKRFVVRYVPYMLSAGTWTGKGLTAAEIRDYRSHGLGIALVFESAAARARGGHDAGAADARTSQAGLARLAGTGIPQDLPIYFAVDFDTTSADWPVLDAYLKGVASVLGAARVGVYAEKSYIDHVRSKKLARYLWQTYAWSGGRDAAGIHIKQYLNGQIINGGAVDLCRAFQDDFGQWPAEEDTVPITTYTPGHSARIRAGGPVRVGPTTPPRFHRRVDRRDARDPLAHPLKGRPHMTYAPATITALAKYWVAQGGVNSGIVGNTRHVKGYHLGKDRIYDGSGPGIGAADYSVQLARDKAGLTDAAAALDLGKLDGSLSKLYAFNRWLVAQCKAKPAEYRDIREVIYSPDGKVVKRWDNHAKVLYTGGDGTGQGDNTHLWHTHISFFRDSESRSKIHMFKPYFETAPVEVPTDMPALTSYVPGHVAKIKVTANVRSAPVIASGNILRVVTGSPETWVVTGWCKGSVDPDSGSDQWLVRWYNGKWEYTAKSNVTEGPAPVPDTSPSTQAQVDAQVKAATDAANARIATMKQKTAAFAVDIADE